MRAFTRCVVKKMFDGRRFYSFYSCDEMIAMRCDDLAQKALTKPACERFYFIFYFVKKEKRIDARAVFSSLGCKVFLLLKGKRDDF